MDEQTATQIAAAQIVDQLGTEAGFMIALRLLQVIAERTRPVTPELVEAFSSCLKGMENFAQVAGVGKFARQGEGAPEEVRDGADQSAGSSVAGEDGGAGPGPAAGAAVVREVEPSNAEEQGGAGGHGSANGRGSSNGSPLA